MASEWVDEEGSNPRAQAQLFASYGDYRLVKVMLQEIARIEANKIFSMRMPWRNYPSIIDDASQQEGLILKFLPSELRSKARFVLQAMAQNLRAIDYVCLFLVSNSSFLDVAVHLMGDKRHNSRRAMLSRPPLLKMIGVSEI